MNTKIFFLKKKKNPTHKQNPGGHTALIVINIIKMWLGHSQKWQIPESCALALDFSYYNLRNLDHSAINPTQSNLEKCVSYNLNSHLGATSTYDK